MAESLRLYKVNPMQPGEVGMQRCIDHVVSGQEKWRGGDADNLGLCSLSGVKGKG